MSSDLAVPHARRAARQGKPRVLSLFSGIGGLDLGLEAAGFEIAASVEIDSAARLTLERNRDQWRQLQPHDIADLAAHSETDVRSMCGQIDVISGAPPCQPFSKAGQWSAGGRNGLSDERGVLIYDVLSLVEVLRPKIVLLENVQGFVRGENSVVPLLEAALPEIERGTGFRYQMDYRVLDAHHYGVAQSRRRAIVTLSRVGDLPWPEPVPEDLRPVAWDAIGCLDPATDNLEARGKWSELLPSIPEGENYQWHTSRGGGLPLFGYRTRYWSFLLKLAKAQPAWTLAAYPGPATGPFHWDSRLLAVEEMLSLQSFPHNWRVEGSRREQVRQIGNATPPALSEVLGRSFAAILGASPPERPIFQMQRGGRIPSAIQTAPVSDKYRTLIGHHDDHPGAGLGPAPRVRSSRSAARTELGADS